jgi:hypothetical protein
VNAIRLLEASIMLSHALPSTALLAALLIGACLLPVSLRAQRSAAADSVNTAHLLAAATLGPVALADAPAAGPRVAAVGITRRMHVDALGPVQSRQNPRGNVGVGSNLALMGTGAAAVVIGLLVGGNGGAAIAVGGGALGLVGFYRYLR